MLVIDASVVVKWLFNDPEHEDWTAQATALMETVVRGDVAVLQPPHWLAEVAAVLARETPMRAAQDARMLTALRLPQTDDAAVLARACQLAIELRHHLFDTLYHALAVERGATLITADERYLRKAEGRPGIVHLHAWRGTQ
jgi:predicted nucleic acid-binding protein